MSTTEQPARRDRTHLLYISVIVAVVLGIVVGLLAPKTGLALKPLGDGFIALIKMMITPIIFCTIVVGVGSIARAAKVGKVGGLAITYFVVMSFVALAIGLIVGNIVQPGTGLHLTDALSKAGEKQAGTPTDTNTFLLGIIPTTLVSSLTSGQVLQALFVALLVGFAIQAIGAKAAPVLRGVEAIQRVVFKILAMIMWAAP
ncbi:cation:dicarboxylate symporter family transporter, partial [Kibdelosporangium lantanae]